jgi:type I restriction enzyme, S subunit
MKKVPKLRFGEFSAPFQRYTLSQLAERVTTKNKAGIENVLTISAEYGLISQLDFFKKSVAGKDLRGYYLLRRNDFAYNKSYSSGYPMGAIKRLKSYDEGIVSTLYICFRAKEIVELDFLEQFFNSGKQNSELEKVAQEGARNHGLLNIGVNDFFDMEIDLPTFPEQVKIGKLLTSVDRRLTDGKIRLSRLEDFKKAAMHRVFSGKLIFGDASWNWSESAFGSIATISKGEQLNKENLSPAGEFPCLNGGILPSGFTDKYNSAGNTICISEGGNSCGYVGFMKRKFWAGGHCYTVRPSTETVDNRFLFYLLKHNEERIMRLRVGSGLPNIQKRDLSNLRLRYPESLAEQTKIAAFLSVLDEKIEKTAAQIAAMEKWKKGLLQQLFC